MYKISYEVRLEDTECGFVIGSCDYGNPSARDDVKTCPAIKMTVSECKSKNAIVSYYEAMHPNETVEDLPLDFREHFTEILDCQYAGWKLVEIMVKPAELELVYYCLDTGENVHATLDIKESRICNLEVDLEVPTQDGNSVATYWMQLETNRQFDGGLGGSTLIEAEYPHLRQRRIFMLTTIDPYRLSVTDVNDL